MGEYELKTRPTGADAAAFLDSVADPLRRADAKAACAMLQEISQSPPTMWGDAIVGFGDIEYRPSSSKRAYKWFLAGVSPRAKYLALYFMPGYQFDECRELLEQLGPHKLGKCCLQIRRLSDVDMPVLRRLAKTLMAKGRGAP